MRHAPSRSIIFILAGLLIMFSCASDKQKSGTYLSEAEQYFHDQEYKKALIQTQNALKLTPESEQAWRLLAKTHLKLDNSKEAFNAFLRLEQVSPQDPDIKFEVATFYMLANNISETEKRVDEILKHHPEHIKTLYLYAGLLKKKQVSLPDLVKTYKKILKIDPKQTKAHIVLAGISLGQKKYGEAEQQLNEAFRIEPDNIQIYKALYALYYSSNQRLKAERLLQDLVSKKQSQAEPMIMLANHYIACKKDAEAIEAFEKAIALEQANIKPYILLARFFSNIGKSDKAEIYFNKALRIDPNDLELQYNFADFLFSHQEINHSEAIVDQILQKRPDHPPFLMLKVKILNQNREYDKTVPILIQLLQEEPDSPEYNYYMGLAYFLKGRIKKAMPFFSVALEASSDYLPARLMMADSYYQEKDYILAQTEAEKVLKVRPNNYRANTLMGKIYIARKKYDEAEKIFTTLIELAPENPLAYYGLGQVKLRQHKDNNALELFEKAITLNPNQIDIFSDIISIYLSSKQYDKGLEQCEKYFIVAGNDLAIQSVICNLKANLLIGRGDIELARKELEKSIEKNPKNILPYYTLANIFKSGNRVEKEIETYNQLIKNRNDKTVIIAYDRLGSIYEKQGKNDLAESCYKKALNLNPEYVSALNNLAYFYTQQDKNLNQALDLARRAKEKAGNVPVVMDTLGWVYFKKELYDEALGELKNCIALQPQNPIFHYHIGLIYNKKWDYTNAKKSLTKALELDPNFDNSEHAKTILSQF